MWKRTIDLAALIITSTMIATLCTGCREAEIEAPIETTSDVTVEITTEVTTEETEITETEATEEENTEAPETEATDVTETEVAETTESQETVETTQTVAPTETTVPATTTVATPVPTSASTVAPTSTPRPTVTPTPTPIPTSNIHTKEEWMQIQGISAYTSTDGATVYGYFCDTSSLDAQVNAYRATLGYEAYAIASNDAITRQAAIDSYSLNAPYFHANVDNWTSASPSDAYSMFYNSAGHRGVWEYDLSQINGTVTMSSASFCVYEYVNDSVGFSRVMYSTVQRIAIDFQY